jgi:DNA-binding MarR family transcriptional regulator
METTQQATRNPIDRNELRGIILDYLFEEDWAENAKEIHEAADLIGRTTYEPGDVTDALCCLIQQGYVEIDHSVSMWPTYSLTDKAYQQLERMDLDMA